MFKPEELEQYLLPTLEELYRHEPESLPFKLPVEPQVTSLKVIYLLPKFYFCTWPRLASDYVYISNSYAILSFLNCFQTLGIPDYFDVVKTPMDLSKIKKKLKTGGYSDPWEYIDDVWLMFENAWLYNKKTSKVYRYATKVLYLVFFGMKLKLII